MALFNTINFLPSVFRSVTNQRFLGATMDQLVTDPADVPVNGYIGRTFSPTYKSTDNYVPETIGQRQQYQLEPSVVVKNKNQQIIFNSTYIDLLDNIANNNGVSNNHQRLFSAETYTYDGKFDYDKFVNYYNYYWLPNGPAAVAISTNSVPYTHQYTVTRNTNIGGYTFSGVGTHPNLQLTLARGGTYTFVINQPGIKFWLQSSPGVSGTQKDIPSVTTRQVYGVKNNGIDQGSITFNVPQPSAQDFYTNMPIATGGTVDAGTDIHYTDIQNQRLSTFLNNFPDGVDGLNAVSTLQNATFVFFNNDLEDINWTTPTIDAGALNTQQINSSVIAQSTVIQNSIRKNVWKINLVPTVDGSDYVIQLQPSYTIAPKTRVFITSGKQYAGNQFWLDNTYLYQAVPTITAVEDYLYYQDSENSDFYGQIKLVDNVASTIDVTTDILNKPAYTAPNGVIFTNGLKIKFDTAVTPFSYANNEYYVEGVGTKIKLIPVNQLIIPEPFGLDIATVPDYITINRGNQNLNPWTRSNRWFHKDVILKTAAYNQTAADYGSNLAGRRPIIEFQADLQLFNFGKKAKAKVNYITVSATNAFVDIEGQPTATIDGTRLKTGDRIIFSNDYDLNILNEIWEVKIERILGSNYITLVKSSDDPVLPGENILITDGQYAGHTFKFDGAQWNQCQSKLTANQSPLFDLADAAGYSFSDPTVYNSSTFAGTKLFGYEIGTGTADSLLGFPVVYKNFKNIGDIVFKNYYDADSFTYVSNQQTTSIACNTGFMIFNDGLSSTTLQNNWVKTVEPSEQYQLFTKFYDGKNITINNVPTAFVEIDVLPTEQTSVPHVNVYLNNAILTPITDYQIVGYGVYTLVALTNIPQLNDKIDVKIFSSTVSRQAYYEIPKNLDFNPLNENFSTITLGQVRTHYNKLIENTSYSLTNNIPVQDHYLVAQGGTLLQHSAPMVYAMTFLNDPTVNFVTGLTYARKEYNKFKNKFLSLTGTISDLDYLDPSAGVDKILQNINLVKNNSFPWYYSDMVPQGQEYTTITYTVINARQTRYEIKSIFDNTILSNRAVLVYVNGQQQVVGKDFTFNLISPEIIFKRPFNAADINTTKIVIKDYASTDGNYIPETPSKLGLYPAFVPEIFLDDTYQTPVNCIRGHDGSITPAFGDFRDQYLLELETRIYNNIKTDYSKNQLNLFDVAPGRFRKTEYSLGEYNSIIAQNFLNWVGVNSVNYLANTTFNVNNPWTWNYSSYPDSIDRTPLPGSWRAIYNYWYDTDTPHVTPWHSLGFAIKPAWWEKRYGPAPYTSGNTLLWEDLSAGYVWNGSDSAAYTDSRFVRPGLIKFIPVDSAGNLLNPTEIAITNIPSVTQYTATDTGKEFSIGQQGPAETAWRRSSDYPYAIQLTLALTKPAKYFATQLDTSRFFANPVTGQFSNATNQHINPLLLTVNGAANANGFDRTCGYINWIADSIKGLGIDPVEKISTYFSNFFTQLSYKVGGFTDDKILTITAEQTSPGSTKSSIIIPTTNYNIYFGKSVPVFSPVYSAVVVEKTNTGFAVSGYDVENPFFNIIPSLANNNTNAITVNNLSINVYQDTTGNLMTIPYGTQFSTAQQLADFLISYQRYLVLIGFTFNAFDKDLSATRDWSLSIKEFLYWAQQGWSTKNIIVLNPAATGIAFASTGVVVDEITNTMAGSKILDQNFLPVKTNSFNVVRTENALGKNQFRIDTLDGSSIALAKLHLVRYEHTIIFDNVDDFKNIIYIPNLGTRQYRLKLTGYKTGAWTGALSAPGYVYNSPNINVWKSNTDYRLGDIVEYNNFYYTATQNISASTTFNSLLWTPIKYNDIQTGLLPNFGHNAQQFVNIYDIDRPPVNQTVQEYSAGLIGFRQRQYLTDLGLSIPTQTKFYQGFIKEKGSMNAITALTKANFNNITSDIKVYEEWAFRTGAYGGLDINRYSEFILDQSVFLNSPVALALTGTYSAGNTIVNLTTANIYTSSNLNNTSTAIYNDRVDDFYINDLPTAGYVNVDDVDYTIFDINNIDLTTSVNTIGAGNKVWVAKDINGQWEVLRTNETHLLGLSITYTLDSYASLHLNSKHSFVAGDLLILKYFNSKFDGMYEVHQVPNSTSVIIKISDVPRALGDISPLQELLRVMTVNGSGIIYKLSTAKVANIPELIATDPPENGWMDDDRVWVDVANQNGWGVYTYNTAWRSNVSVKLTPVADSVGKFGSAVRINESTGFIYVSSPSSSNVQVYSATDNTNLTTISSNHISFGSAIDSQQNILAVGAPSVGEVHVYNQHANASVTKIQTISTAGGNAISISADQQWLYSADPINNQVYAYNFDGTQYQYVTIISGPANSKFGTSIKTNADGSLLFVGAPDATNEYLNDGSVYLYNRNVSAFSQTQVLAGQFKNKSSKFGFSLAIDETAGNLYIGVPGSTSSGQVNGLVERYVFNAVNYVYDQSIAHPNKDVGSFGTSIGVSDNAQVLAVGSQGSPSQERTTFDKNKMIVDTATTIFVDYVINSGAVYLFEPLINDVVAGDTGKYIYTQELEAQVHSNDQFGFSVDVTRNSIIAGAPFTNRAAGTVFKFINPSKSKNWVLSRNQQPSVDIISVGSAFIYNKLNNNILAALDYVDPAKGKILNAVAQDIDYQLTKDPALYNQGTTAIYQDLHWGPKQVGQIWWDLDTVRYINYEQDSLDYRISQWGKMFDGSRIDIYQWVESSVLPSQFYKLGLGTPLNINDNLYSTYGYVDSTGAVKVKYYFWAKDIDTVATGAGKNNSTISIAAAIENPSVQGIPYIEILKNNAVAIYNVNNLLVGKNSILHLGTRADSTNLIHSEYALIQEGNPQSHVPETILNKLIDSLSTIDRVGNPVPDPALPPSQAYGISIRPRQTMIVDPTTALKNYVELVNQYLLAYPVVERKPLTRLNSGEIAPGVDAGQYSLIVNTVEELGYINRNTLSTGYRVLVKTDSTYQGKWSIYAWNTDNLAWDLVHVQSYLTSLYWNFTDWYAQGYDATTAPEATVANQLEFKKLTLVPDTHVRISDDGTGNFIVYYIDSTLTQNVVAIQNGTIQLSTGAIPGLELRQILLAMQEDIFVGDIANKYNTIFFAMIKYILTEQKNLDWVFKTSFISATQKIRKLAEFPSYIPDNQDFYLNYINEVKPYRTIVREFVIDYTGNDYYNSDITDFDLPPYYDSKLSVYRSPNGEAPYDNALLSADNSVYSPWYQNYTYSVVNITVENPGSGFQYPPDIAIVGGGGAGAKAYSVLNGQGGIASIVVTDPGDGYKTTPTVVVNGTGTGAILVARLENIYNGNNSGHNLIRSVSTTIKFDRISYTAANTFVIWSNITASDVGQIISANTIILLDDQLYQLSNNYTINANITFPTTDIREISAADFNNANDRIVAFNGNIDLRLALDGIDYPGVVVEGNSYVGTYYDGIVQSAYSDPLGISPANINIVGGAYVSTYESHAPEELVPGRMYDTLDMMVYDTNLLGFRIFDDLNQNESYYRISSTTTLANTLSLTDSNVYVVDASILPVPDPKHTLPGVVFINGEKIIYYERDLVNNRLGQIRRGADGTSPGSLKYIGEWQANIRAPINSLITYNNNTYLTKGNIYGTNFEILQITNSVIPFAFTPNDPTTYIVQPIGSQAVDGSGKQQVPYTDYQPLTLASDTSYQVVDVSTITLTLILTNPISANAGDIITQYSNPATLIATMRVAATANNSKRISVFVPVGEIQGLPTTFDDSFGWDPSGADALPPGYRMASATPPFQRLGNPAVANLTLQVGDQWTNTADNTLHRWDGAVWQPFDPIPPGIGFDNTPLPLYVNGTLTGAYVRSFSVSGSVGIDGTVTIPAGVRLRQGHVWYTQGASTATDGRGLSNSNTVEANFLKAAETTLPILGQIP